MRSLSRSCLLTLATGAILAGAGLAPGAASAQAPRTIVSLHFDGAVPTQAQAAQLLTARGMKGTFFVNSGLVGTSRSMTWDQITQLAAAGHEIGAFSTRHTNYATMPIDQVRADACADRAAIQSHGLGVANFAYPFGLPSTPAASAIESAVRSCGYGSARTTTVPDAFAESLPPVDALATRAFQWDARHTPADLQNAVTAAETNGGGWIQYAFQHVCDGCDPMWAISPAVLAGFLDWLAARAPRGTVVRTTAEALRTAGVPGSSPTAPPPAPGSAPAPGTGSGGQGRPARLSLTRVRAGQRRVSRRGTLRVSLRLNRAATIRVTAARRVGRRYVTLPRAVTLQGDPGVNRLRVPMRMLRVRRGEHRLTLVATDAAGQRSARKAFRLTVR